MASLRRARVALLESRLGGELASLVLRFGGTPVSALSVREVPRPEDVAAFLDALEAGRFSVVIMLTGVGINAVLREAEQHGALAAAVRALQQTTTVCRGPKPSAVLRRHGVPVQVAAAKPYTTRELLEALELVPLAGASVALVHYGERNEALARALRERGALLTEVCPYEWMLPEDLEPMRGLVRDTIAGAVDAVAFTNQIQCRHLFLVADQMGLSVQLAETLNAKTIVAAIGSVCADTLRQLGVIPDVLPADPKMGALISALADYVELTDKTYPEPEP